MTLPPHGSTTKIKENSNILALSPLWKREKIVSCLFGCYYVAEIWKEIMRRIGLRLN
jgi:hypothetical protein